MAQLVMYICFSKPRGVIPCSLSDLSFHPSIELVAKLGIEILVHLVAKVTRAVLPPGLSDAFMQPK